MRYILVTGAGGGMGRAFTLKAAKNGYSVIALDLRTPDYSGNNIISLECDITNPESVNKAFSVVSKVTNTLFAIVHFAGIYMLNSLIEIDEKDYDKIFRVNVFGPYYINRTFFPFLRKGSRIIITTSELAPLKQLPFTGLYGITKSALDNYAFSLSMELQLKGINVSVLRPGAVKTNMLNTSTTGLENFVNNTKLYKTNATRFRKIVDSVETKAVEPERIADKILSILKKKKPRFAYTINNNFFLTLTRICPGILEKFIIRKILEKKKRT